MSLGGAACCKLHAADRQTKFAGLVGRKLSRNPAVRAPLSSCYPAAHMITCSFISRARSLNVEIEPSVSCQAPGPIYRPVHGLFPVEHLSQRRMPPQSAAQSALPLPHFRYWSVCVHSLGNGPARPAILRGMRGLRLNNANNASQNTDRRLGART